MTEPIKEIDVRGGRAIVYPNQTRYVDDEGEVVAIVPFPVDEKIAELVFKAYQAGYERGTSAGRRHARIELTGLVHELLGVDKIIEALTYLKEGK